MIRIDINHIADIRLCLSAQYHVHSDVVHVPNMGPNTGYSGWGILGHDDSSIAKHYALVYERDVKYCYFHITSTLTIPPVLSFCCINEDYLCGRKSNYSFFLLLHKTMQ